MRPWQRAPPPTRNAGRGHRPAPAPRRLSPPPPPTHRAESAHAAPQDLGPDPTGDCRHCGREAGSESHLLQVEPPVASDWCARCAGARWINVPFGNAGERNIQGWSKRHFLHWAGRHCSVAVCGDVGVVSRSRAWCVVERRGCGG